jgi:hypothetical protein
MSESADDWIRRAAGRSPKPEREPEQHPVDEWIRARMDEYLAGFPTSSPTSVP